MGISIDTTSLYSGKGFDVQAMVDQVLNSQRTQENQWKTEQSTIEKQTTALNSIQSQILDFYNSSTDLTDFSGVLGGKLASSSDTGILFATATKSAALGKHVLRVMSLASTGSAFSTAIGASDPLDIGSFTITVGGVSKNVDIGTTNTSLGDIANAINNLQLGITATVQTDAAGSRLTMVSNNSGAAGAVQITGGTEQLSFTVTQGKDAVVNIDGVPFQNSTNTVTGAIPGVTLNLAGAAPNTDVSLEISPNVSQVAQSIGNFVDSYNAILKSINSQYVYNAATGTAGVLASDTSLYVLQDQLLRVPSYSMSGNGDYNTLRSLGIEMQDDGTLSINSDVLNEVLTNHFSELTNFFQGTESFGQSLHEVVNSLNDPTTGPVALDLVGLSQRNQELTNEVNDFEQRLLSQEAVLLYKYSQVNASLQQLPGLQSQLSQMLDSYLPGSTKS